MKILHIITRMILGGAQENTLLSVIGQKEAGHDVRLLSGPTHGPEGSLLSEIRQESVDFSELPTLIRSIHPVADYQAYHGLRTILRSWKPDVVHTHSSKAGILGRMAAWRERVPSVVHTIHGLPFHPYQIRFEHWTFVQAERYAAKRCHKIVTVADAMRDQALSEGVGKKEQYETVYSGMRMQPFLDEGVNGNAFRERLGISPETVLIGKIARLFELKGHDDLLEAFASIKDKLPHARLLFVGDGLWRERLTQKAETLGIADQVIFAGLIPHEEIPEAVAAMDLLVHCSLREGLARVLPQALLSGVPVISYDVDGAREVVLNNETGLLLPPGDVPAVAQAILTMANDPEKARSMAAAGRELCRNRFDWQQMATRLLDIYQSVLENK